MANNGKKAIKAVLIYNNKNQTTIYAKNYFNDIRVTADLLSPLFHITQLISKNKQSIEGQVESIPMDQFTFMFDNEGLRIRDANGVHNNVHFHDNHKYSGVFSVADYIDHTKSNIVFESLISLIDKDYNTSIGLERKKIMELDNVLEQYQGIFD